jgi:hypothetical protein
VEHRAKPDEQVGVIAVATPPDVRVVSVTPAVVELPPGGRAKVTAAIARAKVRRPRAAERREPAVPRDGAEHRPERHPDHRKSRTAARSTSWTDDNAQPVEQTLLHHARVETNGGTTSEQTSTPYYHRIVGRSAKRAESITRTC